MEQVKTTKISLNEIKKRQKRNYILNKKKFVFYCNFFSLVKYFFTIVCHN